jgi:hypothetical protein
MFLMFIAVGLVVVTVAIHAAGFSALIRTMMRSHALDRSGFRRVTLLVIGLACWLILLNLIEISVGRCPISGWAAFRTPSLRSTVQASPTPPLASATWC